MYLSDLFPEQDLRDMEEQGYVKRQTHPDFSYVILNYTDKAQFDSVWNEVTRSCRGLIFDSSTGEIIARPFRKFFNFGQPEALEIQDHQKVIATDKMDGSLGILYPTPDGKFAIATRGSFTSDQAIHATNLLNSKYYAWLDKHGETIRNYKDTFLFEIIYPQNRIVLDYGRADDLYLLGAVLMYTGGFLPARKLDWDGPKTEVLYEGDHWLLNVEDRVNKEGFVVFCPELNEHIKYKQIDYISKHKAIFGLNARGLWELAKNHEDPFSPKMYADIIMGMPDETHGWIKDTLDELSDNYDVIWEQANQDFFELYNILNPPSRKEFALRAKEKKYPDLLFLLLDKKWDRFAESIWKKIRPEGNKLFRSETGEEDA